MSSPEADSGANLVALLLAPIAALVGAASIFAATVGEVALGLVLHGLAGVLAAMSLPRHAPVYRIGALVTALAVPGLGPVLAPWLMRRPADLARDAHAAFEDEHATKDDVEALVRDGEPVTATMSFHEVLRHGSLDHRRNALRKLADRGQPMHLALLRRCLGHPDMELRLSAFREIDRLLRRREAQLHEIEATALDGGDAAAWTNLSRARRAFAQGGLLDRDMQGLQLDMAASACTNARALAPHDAEVAVEQTLVFLARDDLAGAERTLAAVSPQAADRADVCVARAELAFRLRRFDVVAAQARRLQELRHPIPAWMLELEVAS